MSLPAKDDPIVADIYWGLDTTGKLQQYQVQTFCPKLDERYIPQLEFSEPWAEFFKWKFKDLIKNEMRWGKDDLRKRGFEKQKIRNEAGELITVYYVPESE